jgi:hypothetical protein
MPAQIRFWLNIFCGFIAFFGTIHSVFSQANLLLNGDFKDVNTCSEYKAECGVEGWFYLKDVKVQVNYATPAAKPG